MKCGKKEKQAGIFIRVSIMKQLESSSTSLLRKKEKKKVPDPISVECRRPLILEVVEQW
jgi:hypothetical protein